MLLVEPLEASFQVVLAFSSPRVIVISVASCSFCLIWEIRPGDSGTLLHVKDKNGDFYAHAVFCGIMPNLNPQFSRRGQGAMLPVPHSLTCLHVVAHNLIPAEQTIHVRFFSNDVYYGPVLKDTICKIVPNTQLGPNTVELTNGFGTGKRGLLVKSVKPIHYIGAMDHFRMSGQV